MALLNQGIRQGSSRRAAPEASAAYVRMGALVALYATGAAAFIGYELEQRHVDAGDFFKTVYDPRLPAVPWAQTPTDWALIVTALVFGGIALARRRVARGALMLLAALLIGLSARELVGLAVSEPYRNMLDALDHGQLLIAFRVLGLLVGIAVLIEMARAGRYDSTPGGGIAPGAPAPYDAVPGYGPPPAYAPDGFGRPPLPPGAARPRFTAAGVLLAVGGAVSLAWLIYRLTRPEVYVASGSQVHEGAGAFLRDVVDASYTASVASSYHTVALVVAPVVIAVLLFAGRPAARGAALVLTLVMLYLDVRGLYGYVAEGDLDQYFDSTLGTLALLSTVFTAGLGAAVLFLLIPAREDH
ncbi:hypothetical protein ACIBKX_12580 [Streptomyces sp. NPDC050658]|uniref:hypothetical protein n=1 Tax=unclassified Streptomyces TaxID=2593676 RepID=UPI00342C60F5